MVNGQLPPRGRPWPSFVADPSDSRRASLICGSLDGRGSGRQCSCWQPHSRSPVWLSEPEWHCQFPGKLSMLLLAPSAELATPLIENSCPLAGALEYFAYQQTPKKSSRSCGQSFPVPARKMLLASGSSFRLQQSVRCPHQGNSASKRRAASCRASISQMASDETRIGCGFRLREIRSEERRVGKECRS